MNVIYSPRSLRDLEHIAAYYRTVSDPKIAAAIADRIEHTINRVAQRPESAPRVTRRANVRAVLVLRYPYKIFYRVRPEAIEILHVRHSARRPLNASDL